MLLVEYRLKVQLVKAVVLKAVFAVVLIVLVPCTLLVSTFINPPSTRSMDSLTMCKTVL